MITINVIRENTNPEMIVRLISLGLSDMPIPFRVKEATITISIKQSAEESTGETNQLITILCNWCQLIALAPRAATPAPINPPTTVCVPEIGIPVNEAQPIKENEAILTPSMI